MQVNADFCLCVFMELVTFSIKQSQHFVLQVVSGLSPFAESFKQKLYRQTETRKK